MTKEEQQLFDGRAERLDAYRARIAELETALAEAQKDSERLEWLISASDAGTSDYLSDAIWDDAGKFFFDEMPTVQCVRAAIDAARGQQ